LSTDNVTDGKFHSHYLYIIRQFIFHTAAHESTQGMPRDMPLLDIAPLFTTTA